MNDLEGIGDKHVNWMEQYSREAITQQEKENEENSISYARYTQLNFIV